MFRFRAYRGSDFDLSTRYGMLLNTIFTCFMYASGSEGPLFGVLAQYLIISLTSHSFGPHHLLALSDHVSPSLCATVPILLLVGAFICFGTYWIDKIQLLRFSRLPPQYSAKLALYVLKTFKYAIFLHMCFGCWIFSATKTTGENLFPRPSLSASFENTVQGWIDEAFGCKLQLDETSCEKIPSCLWSVPGSTQGSSAVSSCIINKASEEWNTYANFAWLARLFNALTFPYFFFTLIWLALLILRWTPVISKSLLCQSTNHSCHFVDTFNLTIEIYTVDTCLCVIGVARREGSRWGAVRLGSCQI